MPDAITESFCERCGTRYTFSAPARLNPVRKTRGLATGIKQYLTSTNSLSDAVTNALHQEVESLSERQMEAYHEVFSFCIECRQYACRDKCWNDRLGRCLSCAPATALQDGVESWPGQDLLEPILSGTRPTEDEAPEVVAVAEAIPAWPGADVPAGEDETHADELPAAASETVSAPVVEDDVPTIVQAEEPEAEPVPAAPVVVEAEPEVAPEPEPEPAPVVAAEQDAVSGETPTPDPRVAIEWTLDDPVVEEASPEIVVLHPDPRGDAAAFPEIPAERIAAVVETPEAAARRAQLETLGLPDPGREVPVAARPSVLPYRSLPAPQPMTAPSPLWDASTRKVAGVELDAFRVRECEHCALSLSASARFCRRCGMRQARSA